MIHSVTDLPTGRIHRLPRQFVAAALLIVAGAAGAPAHAQQATGTLTGVVRDATTGAPVVNARIEVGVLGTLSNADGRFRISDLPVGVVAVGASSLGYRPITVNDVVISAGRTSSVVIELDAAAIGMEAITVRPPRFNVRQESPTSTQQLRAEEVRRAPGAQEDVLRAVSVLPGVAPVGVHRNDLIVRGGAPFENLYVVDGLPVQNISHFAAQGSSGGFASLMPVNLIRDVEFSSGGFGAAYGNRVGSVTNVRIRDGSTEDHRQEANLAATGFSLLAEGPLGAGSYLVSGRRSYLDLIMRAAGEPFFLRYWDLTSKISHPLGSNARLSWLFVGALDEFGTNIEEPEDRYEAAILATNQDQYFSGVSLDRFSERSRLRVTAGRVFTRFDTFQDDSLSIRLFSNRSSEAENILRASYLVREGRTTYEGGVIASYSDRLRYNVDLPGFLRVDGAGEERPLAVDTAISAFRSGGFLQITTQLSSQVSASVGARADYYGYLDDAIRVAPRFSISYAATPETTFSLAGGRYWQSPSLIWLVGDESNWENLTPFNVDQAVAGITSLLAEDLKLQVEGYYRRYGSYPARVWRPQAVLAPGTTEHVQYDIPFGLEPSMSEGQGRTFGAEILLQKRLSDVPIHGLISLSVNRSRFAGLDGVTRVGAYDVPAAANVAMGWQPNPLTEVGVRFRAATGVPKSPYIESGPQRGQVDFSRYHEGGRMPAFHALDLRVDRRWQLGSVNVTTYLDVQDVYNRNNPIAYVYDFREDRARYERAIGFVPNIGINVAF